MNVNQLVAAADSAAEHQAALRDRGHTALATLMTARAGLKAVEAAQSASQEALDRLADGRVAGDAIEPEAVSAALAAVTETEGLLRWHQAVVTAAQRALASLQAQAVDAEQAATATALAARRASIHSQVLALTAGNA